MKEFTTIGLVGKPASPLAESAIERAEVWGKKNGVNILCDNRTGNATGRSGLTRAELAERSSLIMVLGGDGTFLAASRVATHKNVPLIGVNLGSLGFITEVHLDQMEEALDHIKKGEFSIEERMMIDMTLQNDDQQVDGVALNDIVLSHKNMAKIIELSISINKTWVTTYRADGLIIASPTGSTAYALSAGGPIMYPTINALSICPICPHTLSNRPLVIPSDSLIEVDIKGQVPVIATMDGQVTMDVQENDHLTIAPSKKVTRIVRIPGHSHFDTLRNKLGWGGSSNNHD